MVFSAIELKTRLEIQDLLNRFCHALQHCDLEIWDSIFSRTATFSSSILGDFQDRAEIRTIPEQVRALGGGSWRFHLFNTVLLPGENRYALTVKLSLATFDCAATAAPQRIADCQFDLRCSTWWHIVRFDAACVTADKSRAKGTPSALDGLRAFLN